MKFTAVVALLLPAVMAAPTAGETGVVKRQTAVTDELLFSISLPAFTTRRNNRNPATLDWSSDNCSWSPDNPVRPTGLVDVQVRQCIDNLPPGRLPL